MPKERGPPPIGGGESERITSEINKLLKEYHPGDEALANIRRKHPKLEDQLLILRICKKTDERISAHVEKLAGKQTRQ